VLTQKCLSSVDSSTLTPSRSLSLALQCVASGILLPGMIHSSPARRCWQGHTAQDQGLSIQIQGFDESGFRFIVNPNLDSLAYRIIWIRWIRRSAFKCYDMIICCPQNLTTFACYNFHKHEAIAVCLWESRQMEENGWCSEGSRDRAVRFHMKPENNNNNKTRLTAICPGLPGWASTRKVKPIWILLRQETVSGSGISWPYASLHLALDR